ncbi:MAG: ADP-ribosyltransferase [Corynebacterium sp.]|nr:ADP-ribosyltransferase [Corynebacterium sp.]
MRKVPAVDEPVQVVRRLRGEELAGSVITDGFELTDIKTWRGQEYKNWGYLSTSTIAQEHFGEVELRLTVRPGTRGIYVGEDRNGVNGLSAIRGENEYLLNRQTRYRIVDVQEENETIVAYAEVIGQDVK